MTEWLEQTLIRARWCIRGWKSGRSILQRGVRLRRSRNSLQENLFNYGKTGLRVHRLNVTIKSRIIKRGTSGHLLFGLEMKVNNGKRSFAVDL